MGLMREEYKLFLVIPIFAVFRTRPPFLYSLAINPGLRHMAVIGRV